MHQTIASNGRTQRLILPDNHQPCGLYTTPTLSVIIKYGSRKFTHSNFKQQSAPHTKISKTVTIAHTELHMIQKTFVVFCLLQVILDALKLHR